MGNKEDLMAPKKICEKLKNSGYEARQNSNPEECIYEVNLGGPKSNVNNREFKGILILRPLSQESEEWQVIYIDPENAIQMRESFGTREGELWKFEAKNTSEQETRLSLKVTTESSEMFVAPKGDSGHKIPVPTAVVSYRDGKLSFDEIIRKVKELDFENDDRNNDSRPDEIDNSSGLPEGAVTQSTVNRYERNIEARKECLRHFGSTICQVCSIDFSVDYGDIGAGFIHVHHVVPLSDIREEYVVNPITDLVPVCPNCHAMLHKRNPPYTVGELKSIRKRLGG